MIDITRGLLAASTEAPAWSPESALQVAVTMLPATGGSVDWDEDSGERWVSVLTDTAVIGIVSTLIPLAFLVRQQSGGSVDIGFEKQLQRVTVADVYDRVLSCAPGALLKAFGEQVLASEALDPEGFSVNELWFAAMS